MCQFLFFLRKQFSSRKYPKSVPEVPPGKSAVPRMLFEQTLRDDVKNETILPSRFVMHVTAGPPYSRRTPALVCFRVWMLGFDGRLPELREHRANLVL